MFTAVILACHIASQSMCVQITDTYGPYATEKECQVRIDEMLGQLVKLLLDNRIPLVFKSAQCIQDKKVGI